MSSWKKNPLAFAPKPDAPTRSWWLDPTMQTDRAAFQQQIIAQEVDRMNRNSSRFTHDKFPGKQKHGR